MINTIMGSIYNRKARKLSGKINSILQGECITLVDIGAAGEIQPRWRQISSLIDYIGFEPDDRSYQEISSRETGCNSYKIYNSAVWSYEGALAINFCRKPMVSSHFNPNRNFVDRFADSARFDVILQKKVDIKRLDDLDIEKVDFIKLDIQGGEVEALAGGQKLLSTCLGMEVEVEFLEMYESQPLFGDVCRYLGERGFDFIDFTSINRWERKEYGFGQSVFGDALYLKSPEAVMEQYANDYSVIKRYVAICALYGRFDLINALNVDSSSFALALSSLQKQHKGIKARFRLLNRVLFFLGGKYFAHLMY